MKNRFIVDFQDKVTNSLLLISLSFLGIFATFHIQETIRSENTTGMLYVGLNLFCIFFSLLSMFLLFWSFKNVIRHFSGRQPEVVFYNDKIEFPKILVNVFSLSDSEKVTVTLKKIDKIKIQGSPNANFCFLKIEFMEGDKKKSIGISKKVFENGIQFNDFLNKLRELNLKIEE